MRRALIGHCTVANGVPAETQLAPGERTGWSVHRKGLRSLLEDEPNTAGSTLLYLDEGGEALPSALASLPRSAPGSRSTVVVVGDHLGYTQEEKSVLEKLGARRVSVGPLPLLASHCIVLVHAELDARSCTAREQ